MKKNKVLKIWFVFMCFTFFLGLMLIFNSTVIGEMTGEKILLINKGSMDADYYKRIIYTTVLNFQIGGSIIAIVGGFGLLISSYLYIKIE